MPGYNSTTTLSFAAGADYQTPVSPTTSPMSAGQYRFCVINASEVTDYVSPDVPGYWYGSSGNPPPIPAGNVLVNTSAGADCIGVISGKALPGQPIAVDVAGQTQVVLGGTVTVGDSLSSDATGAAITHTSTNHILGQALASGVAGDIIGMLFQPRGEA